MPEDLLPHLSLGTAALIIFAVCAAYVLLRGLGRMLAAVLMLAGSAWIAFQAWQHAPGWAIGWTGEPTPWITTGLPIAAFISSFLVIRKVTGFVMRPFARPSAEARSGRSRLAMIALALIPTAVFWLTAVTLLRHAGSVEELRSYAEQTEEAEGFSFSSIVRQLKPAIESIVPESWMLVLDPLGDPSRVSLAKFIADQPDSGLPAVIDPETGRPYPRAIIVNEEDLTDLVRDGRFSMLLRHPQLQKVLDNPEVRELLGESGGRERAAR